MHKRLLDVASLGCRGHKSTFLEIGQLSEKSWLKRRFISYFHLFLFYQKVLVVYGILGLFHVDDVVKLGRIELLRLVMTNSFVYHLGAPPYFKLRTTSRIRF